MFFEIRALVFFKWRNYLRQNYEKLGREYRGKVDFAQNGRNELKMGFLPFLKHFDISFS